MPSIVELIRDQAEAITAQGIHDAIAQAVARGELPAGERLPSVRTLALELGVAAGTVAKAVKSLEASGVVVTNGRHGTRVAAADSVSARARAIIDEAAQGLRDLGVSDDEALDMFRSALREAR